MSTRRLWFTMLATMGALFAATLATSPARANITGGALDITAINAAGDEATLRIDLPNGLTSWTWTSSERMEMRSPKTGDLIAVLNPNGRESMVEYIDDPIINLAFAVAAGPTTTNFFISSALLSFAPLAAEARATAGFSLTDGDGDGATLTGIGDPGGSQGAYLAQYNGFAGTVSGTTFAEVITSMSATAFNTTTASATVPVVGFTTIGAPVSDMSVLVSFSLTANDLASGTSNYVIQQRPTPVEPTSWSRIKSLIQ